MLLSSLNIFGFHERRLFDKFPKPFTYLQYVDDTLVSFKFHSDALKFFDTLNRLHSSPIIYYGGGK